MQFLKPLRTFALGAAVSFLSAQSDLHEAARLDAAGECEAAEKIYTRLLAAPQRSTALMNNAGNHYLTCRDAPAAERWFGEVLKRDSTHGNANLQMARLHLAAGRGAEALPHAQRVRAQGPVAAMVYAEALHAIGQESAARAAAAEAERGIGNDTRLMLALAVTQERIGMWDRAEASYTRLLVDRPDDPQLLLHFGRSAARLNHFDRALRALEAAAKLAPSDADVLLELGRAHVASGDAPRGVYVLAHARKLAPRRPDILLTLARAAEQAQYFGDSALAYDEYLALQPGDEIARRDRALVYGMTQSKLKEGVRDLQAHVRKNPSDATAWFYLARLNWASDAEAALKYLDQAVSVAPGSVEVRFARGWLRYRTGRVQDALPDLRTALEGAPDNVEVMAQIGLTYLSLDKAADAERVLRQALGQAPNHPEILLHLGRALVALDRSEEAQTYLARFQQLRPAVNRGPRTEPGMIESATIPEAERVRRQVQRLRADLQAHPGDVELRLHLAGLLLAQGDLDAATVEYRSSLDRDIDAGLAYRTGKLLSGRRQYQLAIRFLAKAVGGIPEARLDWAVAAWASAGPRAGLDVLKALSPEQQTADIVLLRARLLDADGQSERTSELLDSGLQLKATNARVVCEAASLLVKHGRFDKALEVLQSSSRTDAEPDARAAVKMAGALALLNRTPDAAAHIRAAEQRWPDFAPAYLMQAYIMNRHGQLGEAQKKARVALSLGAPESDVRCLLEKGQRCDLQRYVASSTCENGQ